MYIPEFWVTGKKVKEMINRLILEINKSFDKVKANQEYLKGYIGGTQSQLDKFKNEIGNNGVFLRLKALEKEVEFLKNDNEWTDESFKALKEYLGIESLVGGGYGKIKKSKSTKKVKKS